jgi:hypothetical protein
MAVTEDGTFSAGNYRSHPPAFASDLTNRVHTPMKAPKTPLGHAPTHRRGAHSKGGQLPQSHDAMLPAGETVNDGIDDTHRQGWLSFCPHSGKKLGHPQGWRGNARTWRGK